MVPGNQETAPAISHYNSNRVHGAQGPVENLYQPVENPQKPVVQFEKIVSSHVLEQVRFANP